MARLSLRHWLNRMARSSRSGRRGTDQQYRLTTRLHVEVFEDRCVPSTVTNLSDHDPGSLRDAIATTPAGGTVDFQAGLIGTITLTSGELDITQNLTIMGPGASVITVSGNQAFEVFNIALPARVNISGLTIASGSASTGGGIYNGGTLNLADSTVSGNSAPDGGGGIYNTGTMTLISCTVSNNSVSGFIGSGGGIYNTGTVTISASTFSHNTVNGFNIGIPSAGGAVFNGGILTLSSSTLSGNSASGVDIGLGGAIANGGTATISYSTVSGNSASNGWGGGIYNYRQAALTISYTTLSGNSSFFGGGIYNSGTLNLSSSTLNRDFTLSGNNIDAGGGILNDSLATLTISDSTLTGNSASGGSMENAGGGIEDYGTLTISNSTLSGNSASGGSDVNEGGGIDNFGGTLTLFDTILAGNTATTAPDLDDPDSGFTSQGHNLIGDGTGATGYLPSDLVGTAQNPIDPRLGPLADNGGPTQTMALLPGSPAIDAGDNTDAPQWDQRGPGFPRIVNGIIDIGAFEVQQAVVPTITCSVADSLLWPPNHRLVNVGLSVMVDPPDANLHLLVYANDQASASDAADIGAGTLQLRSERQGHGNGRVYLIVATATNSGGTSFDVCTVAVPHDHSPRSIAAARQQAAAAEAYYREFQTPPPSFRLLGEGPDGGGAPSPGQSGRSIIPGNIFRLNPLAPLASLKQESLLGVLDATVPAEHLLSAWASMPVDGFFATSQKETSRLALPSLEKAGLANGLALDLMMNDDRLVV